MLYDRLASFYDWEHAGFDEDLAMYAGFARAASDPILDAACGTGRVLTYLATAGHQVTGVDVSEGMLAAARRRLSEGALAGRVRLEHADLRTMKLGRRHGMALVALSSFQHLLDTADQRAALGRLAAHLIPGGLLVIDLVNPNPEWLNAGDGAVVHQVTAPLPAEDGEGTLSKFVARTADFHTQMEHWLMVYDRVAEDGVVRRLNFEMETRFLFRYEAELLLAGAGFRVRDLYGDYNLSGYGSASPRMIFVAERQ